MHDEKVLNSRNSRLELLRILSILLIICWHITTQFGERGGVLASRFSAYHVFAIVIGSWGQLGVDLFIIISIHFLRRKNCFRMVKLIDLAFETAFYGIVGILLCTSLDISLSLTQVIKSIFSLFFGKYWFITSYCLLYISSPLLNGVINSISKSLSTRITIVLGLFTTVYKSIYANAPICDFLFFVFVYFLVNELEKEEIHAALLRYSKRGMIILSLSLITANIIIVLIGDFLNSQLVLDNSVYLMHRGSIFVLLDAMFIFYHFANKTPFANKTINMVASTSLGVYLLHQGLPFSFWKHFLDKRVSGQLLSCGHLVICVLVIFIISCTFDLLRQKLIELPFNKLINKRCKQCFAIIDDYLNHQ